MRRRSLLLAAAGAVVAPVAAIADPVVRCVGIDLARGCDITSIAIVRGRFLLSTDIEQCRFSVEDVCRAFNVPREMAAHG